MKDFGTDFEQRLIRQISDWLGTHPDVEVSGELLRTLGYLEQMGATFAAWRHPRNPAWHHRPRAWIEVKMMDNTLFDTAERLFAGLCTPAAVRAIEAGSESIPLWDALEQSGFVQALLPEDAGGAGLALEDVWPVMFSAGRHAIPLPFAQTHAGAWLAARGRPSP